MKFAFTADEHFRSTVPTSRKDDYLDNQHSLIMWLDELSKSIPSLHLGTQFTMQGSDQSQLTL